MTLDKIKALNKIKVDLQARLDKARQSYKQEMEQEVQDIRTKEYAWGKMVAYAHALKLIKTL